MVTPWPPCSRIVEAMRAAWAQVTGLLLLVTVLLGSALAGDALLAEPSLLLGALGALLLAWGVVGRADALPLAVAGSGSAIAARDHHRALARRAVPRQRDPDAAGHTRSRAPSELPPAA